MTKDHRIVELEEAFERKDALKRQGDAYIGSMKRAHQLATRSVYGAGRTTGSAPWYTRQVIIARVCILRARPDMKVALPRVSQGRTSSR